MHRVGPWLTCAFVLLTMVGVANAQEWKKKPPPPPQTDRELGFVDITRDQLLADVKRIGLVPLEILPADLSDREDAKRGLQDAVMKYLQAANFDVVGPASYQAAFDQFNRQLGGVYDASTGDLKRDAANSVVKDALREFASREKLDGFIFLRVVRTTAPYLTDYATWDGVRERTDGQPAGNALADFLAGTNNEGSLPAISLLVQIVSSQGRLLYSRRGGIQTVGYHGWVKKVRQFRFVAPGDQLKDLQRIDRAAREATIPLVHTPKEISVGYEDPSINATRIDLKTLPAPPPGSLIENEPPLLVPREQILKSVHRVALSALDTGGFTVPQEVQQRLMNHTRAELASLNWEVVDAPRAGELLLKALRDVQLYDPFTGKRDEARESAARKSVFSALGMTPMPDAILWVSLTKVGAVHRMGDVEWDGANQNAITLTPVVKKIFGGTREYSAGSGGIAALSLTVYLSDSNDTPLYRSRGGIQLLQKLNYRAPTQYSEGQADPVDLAPSEMFLDQRREMPAVHFALRDLTMTPEALSAELNPEAGTKGKDR